MGTNPRKRRRVHRGRVRIALSALSLGALALVAVPVGGADAADRYTATAEASIADIQGFWEAALPEVYGRAYTPIPDARIFPYSASDPPPACGGSGVTPYEEVAGNAFYCAEGDFVAYDVESLIPHLREQYGDFAVGLVLAHEWGHAIQARVGFPSRTSIYVELQADCFAGAWAEHVAAGDSSGLGLSDDDLDRALAGFLELRDPSGVDGTQDGAHGNAFDRVGAFQDGLEGGAAACRDYTSDPPQVTEAGYTSYTDAATNGDLPLDEVIPLLKTSLDGFWSGAVRDYATAPEVVASASVTAPSCSGSSDGGVLSDAVVYCGETHAIVYSRDTLERAERQIGDLGAGVYLAAAWSSAVEHQLGDSLGTNASRARAECLTGAWAGGVENGSGANGNRDFALSPGDLDEVVATFVATDGHDSNVDRSSVLRRVATFRRGFSGGVAECLAV